MSFSSVTIENYMSRQIWSELLISWVERYLVALSTGYDAGNYRPPLKDTYSHSDINLYGGSIYKTSWDIGDAGYIYAKAMQNFVERLNDEYMIFCEDGSTNQSLKHTLYSFNENPTYNAPYITISSKLKQQGWRRTNYWDDSYDINTFQFEIGPIQKGDIVGPWIIEDLQDAFNLMKKTAHALNASSQTRFAKGLVTRGTVKSASISSNQFLGNSASFGEQELIRRFNESGQVEGNGSSISRTSNWSVDFGGFIWGGTMSSSGTRFALNAPTINSCSYQLYASGQESVFGTFDVMGTNIGYKEIKNVQSGSFPAAKTPWYPNDINTLNFSPYYPPNYAVPPPLFPNQGPTGFITQPTIQTSNLGPLNWDYVIMDWNFTHK